jgi:acetyl-CoA acetyltransferase
MPQPVIVAGARTPIGKLLGALAPLTATQLAGTAIAAALARAGITGDQVDAVILGNVIQAGVGPNPARLSAAVGGVRRHGQQAVPVRPGRDHPGCRASSPSQRVHSAYLRLVSAYS